MVLRFLSRVSLASLRPATRVLTRLQAFFFESSSYPPSPLSRQLCCSRRRSHRRHGPHILFFFQRWGPNRCLACASLCLALSCISCPVVDYCVHSFSFDNLTFCSSTLSTFLSYLTSNRPVPANVSSTLLHLYTARQLSKLSREQRRQTRKPSYQIRGTIVEPCPRPFLLE